MIVDVTDRVETGTVDDELCNVIVCVCGARYDAWAAPISIYDGDADPMPCCGRRLFFSHTVRVFEADSAPKPSSIAHFASGLQLDDED